MPALWLLAVNNFVIGSFVVDGFDDWCGSGLSDHVPLISDVTPNAQTAARSRG